MLKLESIVLWAPKDTIDGINMHLKHEVFEQNMFYIM
jgi:hypothetical protein